MTETSKDCFAASVKEVRDVGGGGFVVCVELPQPLEQPLEGGHFFMLRTEHPDFPFLSRPFSVHDALPDSRGPELHFLLKRVGAGTGCLASMRPGERLELVGPLGGTFPVGDASRTTILVAGGVGLPPMHQYLRRRHETGRDEPVVMLYGAREKQQLFALDAVRDLCEDVRCSTEDGSLGHHGRVDALLEQVLAGSAADGLRVLTCGPDPMMARVAELCAAAGVSCLASLETLMACGFGVCNACAVPYQQDAPPGYRYARACMDGPVMDASRVLWHHGH